MTTAIGLVTLVTSELVPIRKFGMFSALGVMVMFVIMLTYLPAALQIWPQKPRKKPAGDEQSWLDRLAERLLAAAGRLDHPPSRLRGDRLHADHRWRSAMASCTCRRASTC